MTQFCDDRDLLCLEPNVFLNTGRPGQKLAAGSDGALSVTTFSSAGADFVSACVAPGMVLVISPGAVGQVLAEIVSVDSATALTVSAMRADAEAPLIPPPSPAVPTDLAFHVLSFVAQIRAISSSLAERLRQASEVAGVAPAQFADSAQLRQAVAHAVLGTVFVSRAEDAVPADANWAKAQHYREEYRRLVLTLRLSVDADGDGVAEQTRTLGHINLRRI